jgi:hypothetical protein
VSQEGGLINELVRLKGIEKNIDVTTDVKTYGRVKYVYVLITIRFNLTLQFLLNLFFFYLIRYMFHQDRTIPKCNTNRFIADYSKLD